MSITAGFGWLTALSLRSLISILSDSYERRRVRNRFRPESKADFSPDVVIETLRVDRKRAATETVASPNR